MGKILVFTESAGGKLKRSSLELLTAAKKSGQSFAVAAMGSQSGSFASALASSGASEVHVFEDTQFDRYNPELFTASLADLISKSGITIVLASAYDGPRSVSTSGRPLKIERSFGLH